MPILQTQNLTKTYASPHNPVQAVRDLSLTLEKGQALGFFADSGGGKSTALRLIAGLDRPDTGVIHLEGQLATGDGTFIPPRERKIGMLFQGIALWPHMSAERQVEFVLKETIANRNERKQKLDDWFTRVGLQQRRKHKPAGLSYGEAQRVGLLRALANDPALLILDEPFAYLDDDRRQDLIQWLNQLKHEGLSILLASHRPQDFQALCDQVIDMNQQPYRSLTTT